MSVPDTTLVDPIERLTKAPWWFRPFKPADPEMCPPSYEKYNDTEIAELPDGWLDRMWRMSMDMDDEEHWLDRDDVVGHAAQVVMDGECVEVDWALQGPHEEEIEKLGCVTMLSLTQADVLQSYPWMTEGEIEETLSRIKRKHEWKWGEVLMIYADCYKVDMSIKGVTDEA